ncbi:hypothetical protein EVG20_g2405 [Dentipellis fragilis]|uniref:Uncharacterized protein n=1 Tax=Dentipellis fragilis TaxID=205917 RepID=A0A4Y9Z9X9_9AGAM|nr:hypothetical protein EVG20_g2405 [Dentipellis fragilis]
MSGRASVDGENVPSAFLDLNYQLPALIKGLQEGWIASCENAAVVSVLVASIVAQLMSTMGLTGGPDDENGISNHATVKALTVFAYSALLFSCSATISALLLIDEFGELPYRAATRRGIAPEKDEKILASLPDLLDRSGLRSHWSWVRRHWLFSLNAGIGCMIVQIIVYVWSTEGHSVKIVLLLVTVFSILPLLFVIVPRSEAPVTSA